MTGFFEHKPRPAGQSQDQKKLNGSPPIGPKIKTNAIQADELKGSLGATSKINDIAVAFVAGFLLIAPIPIGANHPVAWLGFAVTISIFTTAYALAMHQVAPEQSCRSCRYPVLFTLGLVLILFCAAQMLPARFGGLNHLPDQVQPQRLTLAASASALGLARLVSYALLCVLVLEISGDSRRIARLLSWIFYGVTLHAAWALISLSVLSDTLLFTEKTAYIGFATGTFVNRNSFATYLSMGLMIGLGRILFHIYQPSTRLEQKGTLQQRLSIGFFVQVALSGIIMVTLLATGSRLGVISAILGGLFLLATVLTKTRRFSGRSLSLVLFTAACTISLAALAAAPMLADRVVFLEQSATVRLELFRQSWNMILQRPLLGYGLDSFAPAFELFHQPSLATDLVWIRPHNTYLTLWAELGLVFGSIPILIIGICFVRLLFQIQRSSIFCLPEAVAAASIVVCAAHSLGDFSLEMAANAYLLIALTGFGISEKT